MGNWLSRRVLINEVPLMPDGTQHQQQTQQQHHHHHHHHQNNNNQISTTNQTATSYQQTNAMQQVPRHSLPFYYQAPYPSALLVSHMAEEEQIKIAKRIGLIQHLPTGIYDGGGTSKTVRECVICMIEFSKGDSVRFLPCLHIYHVHCIDEWLVRSFICPSCMEPVDISLLSTF